MQAGRQARVFGQRFMPKRRALVAALANGVSREGGLAPQVLAGY